jgi:hypothetical protein
MIIFDSTARRVNRKPFAAGLTINPPRAPFTTADLAWAAANLNANATDFVVVGPADSVLDQKAGESVALNAFEAGYRNF